MQNLEIACKQTPTAAPLKLILNANAVESGAGGEKSHVYGVGEVATAKEGEVAEGGHGCRNAENEGEFECGRG